MSQMERINKTFCGCYIEENVTVSTESLVRGNRDT